MEKVKGDDVLELMGTFAPQTRLFKGPDISSEQLAIIPRNTRVEMLNTCNHFFRVAFTDESGHRFEGYVVSNFLKPLAYDPEPIVVDSAPPPTTKGDGWFSTHGPKFDRTTGWLAVGLVLLLLVNVFSTVVLCIKVKNLPTPSFSASCSGISSYQLDPLKWLSQMEAKIVRLGAQPGDVEVSIAFKLRQKERGSDVILQYRADGPEAMWQELQIEPVDALDYMQTLNLDAGLNWEYRIVEMAQGEVTRVSDKDVISLAGSAVRDCVYLEVLDPGVAPENEIELRFWCLPQATSPAISLIRLEFSSREDYEEFESEHVVVLTDTTELGEGYGDVFDCSVTRDSRWKSIKLLITFVNGNQWSRTLNLDALLNEQSHYFNHYW